MGIQAGGLSMNRFASKIRISHKIHAVEENGWVNVWKLAIFLPPEQKTPTFSKIFTKTTAKKMCIFRLFSNEIFPPSPPPNNLFSPPPTIHHFTHQLGIGLLRRPSLRLLMPRNAVADRGVAKIPLLRIVWGDSLIFLGQMLVYRLGSGLGK